MSQNDEVRLAKFNQIADLLLSGHSVTSAAETMDMARETLSRWLNHDAALISIMNQMRLAMWENSADRLRGLAHKSVDTLEQLLDSESPEIQIKAATLVFKSLATHPYGGRPSGSLTEEAVVNELLFRDL